MRVTGMPLSSAEMAVHFPVPFCPAESRIFSTKGFPSVSYRIENSIRYSTSNTTLDHLFKYFIAQVRTPDICVAINYTLWPRSLSCFVCACLNCPPPSYVHFASTYVSLVIFVGTNFRKTGPNLGFRNIHSFNFCGQWIGSPCCTAKAEQIVYRERWLFRLFVPVWEKTWK